jgi:hypothetical protein
MFPSDDDEVERLRGHADSVRCVEFIRGKCYRGNIKFICYLFKFQERRTIKGLTKIIPYDEMWHLYFKIGDYKKIFDDIKKNSIFEPVIGKNIDSKEKSWLSEGEKMEISKINNKIANNNYYYRKKGTIKKKKELKKKNLKEPKA